MRLYFTQHDGLVERSGRAEREADGGLTVFWGGEEREHVEAGEWFELGEDRIAIRRANAPASAQEHRDG